MTEKIIEVIKKGDYRVPYTLLTNYNKMKITEKELVILIYLINTNEPFNPKKIGEELGIKMIDVLNLIDELQTKGLIELKLETKNNIKEDAIYLDNLYKRIGFIMSTTQQPIDSETNDKKLNIFDAFEREFSRTLSPMEYEVINAWMEKDFNEEIIKEALKEAVYNGAKNLRYVDKILFEWKKKGINTIEDINKNREAFNNKNNQSKPKELLDYDWLNEADE